MRVFLSAGEPSGDHHAAALVRALKSQSPGVECIGLGGPCMASAGCRLLADLTQLAVMWFARVILSLHRFVDLARRAERSFLDNRPDVCVLVDFPGFHWWLAWRAKRHGIPVVFYCPPQIWAWASWRIRKMKRLVDHVLSALPFEDAWFRSQGMASTLVGHPFFDELVGAACDADDRGRDGGMVLLLPGSRGQEIEGNLVVLLRAASLVAGRVPRARFVVAVLHERHAARVHHAIKAHRAMLAGSQIAVEAGRARSLMREARCALAVSGSVSLELLAARVPTAIVYRISGLAYVVQSWFRHARFITLVNLLAVRKPIGKTQPIWWPPARVSAADPEAIYPEYLAVQDPAPELAGHVVEWLADEVVRRRVVARLDALAAAVGSGGSAERAAAAVLTIATGAATPYGQPAGRHGRVRRGSLPPQPADAA